MIRFATMFACATLLVATQATAATQIDPTAYPELSVEALLPAVLAELKHTEPDIYSVREMKMCPAEHIKLVDGRPVDWSVRIEFNSKNQAGGYTGIRREIAIFRKGKIAYPISSLQLGRTGLEGLLARKVDKQMAECGSVPDAAIQAVLTGGGR